MGSLSPEAEGVEEFVVDALNNLADGSHPPPELLGPAPLAGVSFGWMDDLYTRALKPPPMVFFALKTLVGYIRSRADRPHAFEPGVRVSPEGEEALSQRLVGGGGSPKQKPVITPVQSTAVSRLKPSYHPRLLDQPMSACPANHPDPRRFASRIGIAELSNAS
jgi:hypothetical protein